MKVQFRTKWIGPRAIRYRPGIHELPEEFRKLLPSSAKVIEEPKPVEPIKPAAGKL